MSMDWFRWHHGTVTDPKWRVISRKSGVSVRDVLAVFAFFLERASQAESRGSIAGWVADDIADAFDMDAAEVTAIYDAMQGKVLDGDRFKPWRRGRSPFPLKMYSVFAEEWMRIRSAVFERDDYTCVYCGARGVSLECDHIIPASRGGSNDMTNLATACKPCNRSKRDKTPEEWRAQ